MSALSQNTAEWLEVRKSKNGGSDAPAIMQVSPWKTPYQLWEEKMDLVPAKDPTAAMRKGLALEDQARQLLEDMTGHFFLPKVVFHSKHEWMIASLDGIDAENRYIAEIKYANAQDHAIALTGQIPQKYFPQLQHQLEVCQLEMSYYFSYDGEAGTIVKVYRDDKYIKKMLQKEQQFFDYMETFTAPPLTDRDYIPKNEDLWREKAAELLQVRQQLQSLKDLETKEKELEKALIYMADGRNSIGAGIKLSKVVRRGNVDYAKIPKLQDVNLERYRKSPIEYWKISEQ